MTANPYLLLRLHPVLSIVCLCTLFGFLLINAAFIQQPVEVSGVDLFVSDLDRSGAFFQEVLSFLPVTVAEVATDELTLGLGDERIRLRRRLSPNSPATRPANNIGFEHLAIVVSDMDSACEKLVAAGVILVSAQPQTLPAWNRDVAGVRAIYFRDPDGHFLELIEYPSNKGEPRWHRKNGGLFLGIDHTAIVVRRTEASRNFYRDALGLIVAGESLNSGREQEALSGVDGARVRVTSLRGGRGPGIELLEYEAPGLVEKPAPPSTSDWRINLRMLAAQHVSAISSDPDGHELRPTLVVDTSRLTYAHAAIAAHWKRYLMEAAELGIFMIVTLWLTLLLEHPASHIRKKLSSGLLRRALMGAAIGGTVVLLIRSPWGTQSGAHFNPAFTLSYLYLGKISAWDALFYVLAQFFGGWLGLSLATLPFRTAAKHEKVDHAATVPRIGGIALTLGAEFIISFVLLGALLLVQQRPALKSFTAFFAGALLLIYITFESPISGMSLNPARTAASAALNGRLAGVWPYFIAPISGMLLAARLFGE